MYSKSRKTSATIVYKIRVINFGLGGSGGGDCSPAARFGEALSWTVQMDQDLKKAYKCVEVRGGAVRRDIVGSILGGVIGIFHWINPSRLSL